MEYKKKAPLAPSCACERVFSRWGTGCHHVELGVSRFIPSTHVTASLEDSHG